MMPLGCSRSESANLPTYFTRKEEKKGEIAKLRQLQNFSTQERHKVFVQDKRFFFQFCDIEKLAKFSKK
jgi:hypothetical protein